MSKTLGLVLFVTGAVIGSVSTWYYVKDKYSKIANEEIESVKEVFSKRDIKKENAVASNMNKPNISEYVATINNQEYTNYANMEVPSKKTIEDISFIKEKPYVITPDEFGEIDEYETLGLIYYTDGVLTDDDNNIIGDVENTVGEDFHEHFGEYEDDSVFVRNDEKECDYEILLDHRKFTEVRIRKPHEVND